MINNKKFCSELNMKKDFTIIAHRGASGYELENSLSAFQKAVELKAAVIETDVQRTKDNILVLNHFDNLYFVTNKYKIISKLEYKELKNIKLKNGEQIPTLNDLLERYKGKIKFNLQLKGHNIERLLVESVNNHDLLDDVVFSAFRIRNLKKIKRIEPRARFELLTIFPYRIFQLIYYFKNLVKLGVTAINPIYPILTKGLINHAHQFGLKIYPWTVNNKEKIIELKKKGIDGVVTNYPDIII